jgi:hypothetical protein
MTKDNKDADADADDDDIPDLVGQNFESKVE